MKIKELKLDYEATISQMISTNGFLHYGLWTNEPKVNNYSFEMVAAAQLRYFELMIEHFPNGVNRILDVGSGTGSNALALINKNYQVDCLSPSSHLNTIARSKLPSSSTIYECKYEDFNCRYKHYDYIFFAESFHYIDPKLALVNIENQSKFGALIFDYFPRKNKNKKITYSEFENFVHENKNLKIKDSIDFTNQIAITFDAFHNLLNQQLATLLIKFAKSLRAKKPILGLLPSIFIEQKANRLLKKRSRRSSFEDNFEYRLITLEQYK